MSITLAELIRDVANAHQDLKMATADRVGSVSADSATFSSTMDLLEEDDYYRGAEVYFTSGLNTGQTRRIYGSDYETQTITIIPTLVNVPQVGDTIEIYNRRGFGRTRGEYKQVINRAIREATGNYMEPIYAEPGDLDGTGYVELPADFVSICGISYWDNTLESFVAIKRAVKPGRNGWWVHPGTDRLLVLSDYWREGTRDLAYALHGFKNPDQLTTDASTTDLDPEWLVETAGGIIQMSNRNNDQNLAPGQYMRNRADAVRSKMVTTQQPNCVRIP